MKTIVIVLGALLLATNAQAQTRRNQPTGPVLAESNSSMLVKMTSDVSSTTSKVGDVITGVLIDPTYERGDRVEGRVTRADHAILNFTFDTLYHGGKKYQMQSVIISITSSHGNEGMDDLDQRLRVEGRGFITYGTRTELHEGAEVRITAWKK